MSLPTTLSYSTVDVFTTTKFAGNPLAIVQIPSGVALTQEQKQRIAKEFNYAETVFVHARDEQESPSTARDEPEWTIDIFTVEEELPFAGHPVIGTASLLLSAHASTLPPSSSEASNTIHAFFRVRAGRIALSYELSTQRVRASIPHSVRIHRVPFASSALRALVPALSAADTPAESPVVSIVRGMTFVLVRLESLAALASVGMPASRVAHQLDDGWDAGLVGLYFYHVLGRDEDGGSALRVRARMFEASVGEDPATGSAACTLAAFLALNEGAHKGERLQSFAIEQGVEMGRPSSIGVEVSLGSTGEVEGVCLVGTAVRVMDGVIRGD